MTHLKFFESHILFSYAIISLLLRFVYVNFSFLLGDDCLNLNKRIFDLLQKSRRSQKELAEAIGVSPNNINSWKSRGTDPPASLIMSIAQFFGISVESLLMGEDFPAPNLIEGNVTGSAVVQGSHHSNAVVTNDSNAFSKEEEELLRLFKSLDVKRRIKILNLAFELEEELKSKQSE